MPRRSSIAKLPPSVRAEFHQRLVAADFGEVVQISAWLAAQGYAVCKSAISEYGMANKKSIVLDVRQQDVLNSHGGRHLAEIRLRCLEAATGNGPAKTALSRAGTYLAWVLEA